MGTTSGYITRNQDLIINMDAANSRSYTSGSTTCECLVSTVSGTLEGGTSFTSEYKGGWVFGGSNDYLNLGNRPNINPELDSFTVNIFFKINSSSSSSSIIASKGNGSDSDIGWLLYYSNTNDILTVRCNGNNTTSERAAQHISITKGQVYMVTMVINRDDNTIKGYLNGSNVGWVNGNYSQTFSGNSISGFGSITNSDDFLIGERPLLNLPMYGTIYLFQTYNFALSESQVYRNFRFFGGRYDLSVPPPPPSFFNDYSFEFDGADDYFATDLTIPSVMLGNFSMSFWIKMVPVSLGTYLRKHPVAVSTSVTAIDQTVHVRAWNTQYLVRQIGSLGGTGGVGTTDLSDNNWHHIAYTYTYDGGTTYYTVNIYVDGNATPEVTSTMRTTGGYQTQGLYSIGVLTNWNKTLYSGTEFPGLIDEITGWDSALSTADIATLAGGPNNPTTALSVVPIAWYRMGDNGIYKSPQWLLPSNENKDKASNYSMSFDGTNDYVDCGNIPEIKNNTEMTLSFWAKIEDTSFRILFGQNLVSGNDNFQLYYWGADTLYIWIKNGGTGTVSYVDTSGIINVGEWYHFTMVFNGSLTNDDRCKLFLNGGSDIITNRGTMPTAFTNSDEPFLIGRGLNGYYQGNIDNVAIWDSDQSANVSTIYNGGVPSDLSSLNPINYYKMGENATFKDPQWLIPNNENKDKISNYSMSFDGTDDWVNCGRDSSLDFNNAITISAWIKTDVTAGTTVMPILFKDGTGGTSRCYSLGFRPLSAGYDKAYIGIFHTNGNNTSVYTSTAGALSNGNWHHLMGTYDGTDNTDALKIYVDGVLDNTATPTPGDTGIHIKTNVDVAIGSLSHGTSWWWEGGIDEVAVWGTDQSSNISFIYSGGTGGTPPDLSSLNPISYWKMGEDATFSTNWTVPDQIGSNDGTSANMDIYDRVGESPGSSGNTVSYNMDIYDRVGSASGSENNALSYNMVLSGRTTDVPT